MIHKLLTFVFLTILGASVAHADETLDRIKSNGKITVATEAAFKPFEYVDNGEIVGFGSDLLAEVVKDLDVEVEQLDLPFQGILAGLAAGQYDLVATSVAINPERAKSYAFSRPFAAISNVIVVPAGESEITAIEALNGRVVGTQLGSSTEAVARQIDEELKAAGGDGFSDLRLFQTFPDTAFALRSGQIDAIVISSVSAGEFMAASPDSFKVVAEYGDPVYISWVTRLDSRDLLASVDATISRLAESGELYAMQEKWVGIRSDSPADGYLPEGAAQTK
ncbi:transporter substrate-binding domain-containing protein [Microbaculum marinisediminis]|uniref:Transporter substrate-binding domain-containing protein n=1 Tax=Microbaculum marinisediminis TaxID=2931392 RepID=A0AAW5R3B7_9HYPH|nr:transporter substrate-binding domain-containing protein [Microbaculum sp. A6E488]MCT8973885.1 transporter substrate-binding domain-containing protein [Microbaculum sp. A6E488]